MGGDDASVNCPAQKMWPAAPGSSGRRALRERRVNEPRQTVGSDRGEHRVGVFGGRSSARAPARPAVGPRLDTGWHTGERPGAPSDRGKKRTGACTVATQPSPCRRAALFRRIPLAPFSTFACSRIAGRVGVAMIVGLFVPIACTSLSPPGGGQDAGGDAATADATPDVGVGDGASEASDSGLPQCASTQRCVGYPSFGDWVCRESCSAPDSGDCPSGQECRSVSGCCTGAACSATSANVCVPSSPGDDAGSDGSSDAADGSDAADAADGADGAYQDADAGFPQCTSTQGCVGYPSFGDWVCLETCSAPDAGDCPSGQECRRVSGCCAGAACAAVTVDVCVTP
jgi:hypothetical protein